jgi:hypothetical protein
MMQKDDVNLLGRPPKKYKEAAVHHRTVAELKAEAAAARAKQQPEPRKSQFPPISNGADIKAANIKFPDSIVVDLLSRSEKM